MDKATERRVESRHQRQRSGAIRQRRRRSCIVQSHCLPPVLLTLAAESVYVPSCLLCTAHRVDSPAADSAGSAAMATETTGSRESADCGGRRLCAVCADDVLVADVRRSNSRRMRADRNAVQRGGDGRSAVAVQRAAERPAARQREKKNLRDGRSYGHTDCIPKLTNRLQLLLTSCCRRDG